MFFLIEEDYIDKCVCMMYVTFMARVDIINFW